MIFTYNYLEGLWLWAWLGFFASQTLILVLDQLPNRHGAGQPLEPRLRAPWIAVCVLIALPVLTASLRYLTVYLELAPSWTALVGIGPLLGSLLILSGLSVPLAKAEENYRLFIGTLLSQLLCFVAALWFIVTLFMTGNPSPLPLYLPVLNPLELQEALCAAVIIIVHTAYRKAGLPALSRAALAVTADIMAFFWIIAILFRSVHFFGKIPVGSLGSSDAFNLALFIFWALWGIGHIIAGHRFALRPVWIAGAVLTLADIAKLILLDMANTGTLARIASFFIAGLILLFIGWAAPLPPALKPGSAIEEKK
jgi:uncharacterized membrane protein